MKYKQTTLGITIILILAWCMLPSPTWSQDQCGLLPSGGTLTGIINTYYPGVGTANMGATSITVGPADISGGGASTAIAVGDMLLVIQMQDADINYTNTNSYGDGVAGEPANGWTNLNSSGYFEYVIATTALPNTGGVVNIVGADAGNGLLNTYHAAAATATVGQRTFQVVHVPQYKSATLSSTLTAAAWNGSTGGILAIDVSGTLTLGGTVNLDGKGFRGGGGKQWAGSDLASRTDYRNQADNTAHGVKGEGIAGTPSYVYNGGIGGTSVVNGSGYPDGSTAKGAPGNAGGGGTDGHPRISDPSPCNKGNNYNSGGGGGGNGGSGGYGGNSYIGANVCNDDNVTQRRGNPGAAFPAETGGVTHNARISMGGGGGAGSNNDSGSPYSSGGHGGGIVLIRAYEVTGTGTITANGNGNGIAAITPVYDGSGGGGAGGTIVVVAATGTWSNLTVQAQGGGGVDNTQVFCSRAPYGVPYCYTGPGGGGGGGVLWLSGTPAATSSVAGGVHGVTTFDKVAYGSTNGANGTISTGVLPSELPGVQLCPAPTWARISGVRVDSVGVIEFATASQIGSRAFNIYETWDPKGSGERLLLTDEAIPAAPLAVVDQAVYRANTRPLKAPYILIEELEYGGGTHLMGPFPVEDGPRAEQLSRIEGRLAEKAVRDQGEAAPDVAAFLQSGLKQQGTKISAKAGWSTLKALKIEVSRAGTVHVPVAELVLAGLPANYAVSPKLLRLTNLGQPVPFEVLKDDTGAAIIEFSSAPVSTDYTGRNVYVVSWGATGTPAPRVKLSKSGFAELPGMTRFEQNRYYVPFVSPKGDPWVWDFVSAGYAPELQFNLPGPPPATSTSIPVRIGVYGGTDDSYTIKAFLNGSQVGRVTFSGKSMKEIRGNVSSASLRAGSNTVTFEVSGSNGARAFVDVIDLGIPLPLPTDVVSYDLIAPYDPSLPLNPRDPQYLIITHGSFLNAANSVAASKSSEHRVAVIDVERAYDHYSAGIVEAKAIAALIAEVRKTSCQKLQYVLLVGGDTFDPRDFLGSGRVSFIPSLNGWNEIIGRVPSENRYADTNGDGLPEVAIGRLPVSTAEEARVMADKIANQAAMVAVGKEEPVQVMVVDDQGPNDASFYNAALEIRKYLPSHTSLKWAKVEAGFDKARSNLLDGLQGGAQATHFFGHGSFEFWTDNGLLTLEDMESLVGGGKGSVVFTWTCQAQNYRYHSDDVASRPTINEALILVPNGGAVACVGPAGVTEPSQQRMLYLPLYDNLKRGMTLGQALRSAKVKALRSGESARAVVDGWNLLGDPSLQLNWKTIKK